MWHDGYIVWINTLCLPWYFCCALKILFCIFTHEIALGEISMINDGKVKENC